MHPATKYGNVTSPWTEEEQEVRGSIGKCTMAFDHEEVYGGCIHCGAQFDPEDED